MHYKSQLSLITALIGLRILTLLSAFFGTEMPLFLTPHILLLYTVFDILIIFYLYHFVKGIKKQKFSLIAIVLISLSLIYEHLAFYYFFTDISTLSQFQIQLIPIPAALIHIVGKIILSVQLIKNKATDSSKKYMVRLGWSYILVFLIGTVFPFANIFIEEFRDSNFYVLNFSITIPLFAMIMLYANEWKHNSDTNDYSGGPTVDSEI